MHHMSLTEFSFKLGLYDEALARTPEYEALLIELLAEESLESCWHHLGTTSGYDLCRLKATSLWSPALRYIHYLLSHSLTGRGNSIVLVNRRNFNCLLSIINGFHWHLGYEISLAIHHQVIDHRVGVIFTGPYISRLIRRMGL